MRLLYFNETGGFSLTDDSIDNEHFPYAILSHTWGPEEVTFEDFTTGSDDGKNGYGKIKFCGEQAQRDNLKYFWVDTCCIKKSDNTELQYAINSMFRWYGNAAKCYVYLSDVSGPTLSADSPTQSWESAFRKSRWFTRGWTLQELIAPNSVDFFSKESQRLGSKETLQRYICEITSIPAKALHGDSLSEFSKEERMSWAEHRNTKYPEDRIYSLLGIFGIHMPLIYGEGKDNAFRRLQEEIDKDLKGRKREGFSVPFSLADVFKAEHFVGREEELADMHRTLRGDGSRRTVVLHGLGGIGKTQLTVAYAKRHKDAYSAIFWLNANDEDSMKQSFAKVAKRILREHPSASRLSSVDTESKLEKVVEAVNEWLSLSYNTRWLMIYDNYDNPKIPGQEDPSALDIREYLPESYQGSVIITTRSSEVEIGKTLQIRKIENVRESLLILSHTSRREGLINDPDAIELTKKLDGLPLALATAGAYLRVRAVSFPDYLRLYNESWLKLQIKSPRLSSYDKTLYSTWQISFDQVEKQNKLSAKLLQLWAYFDNQDLWLELLQHVNAEDPGWMRELTKDELEFNDAVGVLCSHGLVEANKSPYELIESGGYGMHSCVHAWTIHILNQEYDHKLASTALKVVGSHVPDKKATKPWLTQRRLLLHAGRCSDILKSGLAIEDNLEWTYHNLGLLYADLGKLDEAEKMYQRALQGYEKIWGPDHTSTLDTVNNLAILYADLGKLDEAEKMHQRALQGCEKALGPDHTSILSTVNNLGVLYANLGKLDEAEKMYQRALQGKEKTLGPDHTSTLDTVNNLGILYADLGKLDEAEKMYQRALQGKEKAWGPDHTSILSTVNNLGLLYANLGKLDEAENMYQRALQGSEKAWGPDHTLSLRTASNLVNLYYERYFLLKEGRAASRRQELQNPLIAGILDVINLCEKYGRMRPSIFSTLGRMLTGADYDDDSAVAFRCQSRLSSLGSGAFDVFCDGCRKLFSVSMERYVCKACKDIDLCVDCFKDYEIEGFIPRESPRKCQAHSFIALSEDSGYPQLDSLDDSWLEWLRTIRVRYELASEGLS